MRRGHVNDAAPALSFISGTAKDYEFSGTSMRGHWQSGYEDTRRTLKRQEWMMMPPPGSGVLVYDVHRQQED